MVSPAPADPRRGQALELILRSQAELLQARDRPQGVQRLLNGLVRRMALDGAALAWVHGTRLRGLHWADASAGSGTAGAGPELQRPLMAALHEALDQATVLVTPADPSRPESVPPVRAAQLQWLSALQAADRGSVICVPLPAASPVQADPALPAPPPLAVLCVWRANGLPLAWGEGRVLQTLAGLASPVLSLLSSRDDRWRARWTRWWARPGWTPAQRRLRRVVLATVAAAIVLLAVVPLPRHASGTARLEAALQRVLVAPQDGLLLQVHSRPGDRVSEGELLLQLADQDLRVELERWNSQLEQARTSLAEANARADRAQLVIQMAKVAEAQAQVTLVQQQLERTRILAPFDAVVVQGDNSQRLGAPVKAGTELITLAPADRWRVIVAVPETEIARVAVGQTGSLALGSLPWSTLPLRVQRITPMATALAGDNVFEVEAELLEPAPDLRPGMSGQARLAVGHTPPLLTLAESAGSALRLAWWRLAGPLP